MKLFCIVAGENQVFLVDVDTDDRIADLQNLIYEDQPRLRTLRPRHLALWKLKESLTIRPAETMATRLEQLGTEVSQYAVKLKEPTDKVSDCFSDATLQDHLHIIVQVPPARISPSSTSKRSKHLDSTDERDVKRPRDSASHASDVEDLNQLWKMLWEGGVNPVKEVAVQRGSDPLQDTEVPTTMKVLHGLPKLFAPNDMFIRDDYEKAWSIIETKIESGDNALVIIGHPGIGKTILLYYLLAIRLYRRQPTIFQFLPDKIFLFHANGVSVSDDFQAFYSEGRSEDIWALVDCNSEVKRPAPALCDCISPFFLIMASSPRASNWDDVIHYMPPIDFWFLEPFTLVELIQASVSQLALLSGYSRHTYPSRQLQKFENTESNIRDFFEITIVSAQVRRTSWDTITKALTAGDEGVELEDECSHKIILIGPQADDSSLPRIQIVTKHVIQMLWEKDANEHWRNYRQLHGTLFHHHQKTLH
ncbi:hypothetical protein M413DRAFT_397524 [Hebeloma cylindrosporum]|uniref:Crinkler effector protein N-terminal domain-containing protein n=1 Tax=Hebeloma cylindrosporum TaxID=76867 RepID=A0A0C3C2Q1_HEBCY|nr:hypothetical protein M413DRAFT_397524 [Hebeloma cylindrosporum h7]